MTEDAKNSNTEPLSIRKPSSFENLNRFKPKTPSADRVGTLPLELPVTRITAVADFVRLHPDDEFWTDEMCFVSVPIKGDRQDSLHVIVPEIAIEHALRYRVFRLALGMKANGEVFLCEVPCQGLDNSWVKTMHEGCMFARDRWTKVTSRRTEDPPSDSYRSIFARHEEAFPAPRWPAQTRTELLDVAFNGRVIDHDAHPGLLRLIGAKLT